MSIKERISSLFNAHSRKTATWGLIGGQAGLDLGAAAVILGLGVASAPLTLVFMTAAGAAGAGLAAYKLTKPEAPKPVSAPAAPTL